MLIRHDREETRDWLVLVKAMIVIDLINHFNIQHDQSAAAAERCLNLQTSIGSQIIQH